jgi:hypothetical protein
VRGAEVRKSAGLRKSVLINEPCIVEGSCLTVHIIRGTKLAIGGARFAAGDTVAATDPGPSHCVARIDCEFVGHKHKATLPHRYVENLTTRGWHAVHG